MNIKYFLFYLILFNLFSNDLNAGDTFLKNLNWFNKENLTAPIKLIIDGKEVDLEQDTEELVKYFQNKPFDYDLLPRINIPNAQEIEYAKLIKDNKYDLQKTFNFVDLPSNLTWSENPLQSRNWQFKLHTLDYIRWYLMCGYIDTKDIWYINRLKFMTSDWWTDNFKPNFPSKEFSWYNHTIPLRLDSYMKIFEFIRRNNALDKESTTTILRAIYWHARVLAEEESLYMKDHNHGLDQAYNLFKASQFFSEFSLSNQWEKISRVRLKSEMLFALTSEGIQKENSPGYHTYFAPYIFSIDEFANRNTYKPIIKESKKIANGGVKFVTAITRPDGMLPEIGDTSSGIHPELRYPNIENLPYFPYYQYIISDGKLGKKPKENVFSFQESGYYVYRDKWDKPGENTATQLILKCGFLSITHRHNDDGSILLYGIGEDWLIDAGVYGYTFNDYRKYAMSASAHNISFPYSEKIGDLLDRDRNKLLEKRFSVYKDNWGLIESDNNHAICESHMFTGYTYKRTMRITGERTFSLTDSLMPENKENQKKNIFMTIFRVPDNKEVYINPHKKTIIALNKSGTAGLEIHYYKTFKNINLYRGKDGAITSLKTTGWQKMQPIKTIAFVDHNKSYSADFELQLVVSPSLQGFQKMDVNHTSMGTTVKIQNDSKHITFNVHPIWNDVMIAFYLYKDDERIDTQWYSKNFSYSLKKTKHGKGTYRVGYFIIDANSNNPSKAKKLETGFSKMIEIK